MFPFLDLSLSFWDVEGKSNFCRVSFQNKKKKTREDKREYELVSYIKALILNTPVFLISRSLSLGSRKARKTHDKYKFPQVISHCLTSHPRT